MPDCKEICKHLKTSGGWSFGITPQNEKFSMAKCLISPISDQPPDKSSVEQVADGFSANMTTLTHTARFCNVADDPDMQRKCSRFKETTT